jgi:hypothetical protein
MRPVRAFETRRVVARPIETAASIRPVKGKQRASARNVFHRTISPERRSFRRRSRWRCTLRPPDDDRLDAPRCLARPRTIRNWLAPAWKGFVRFRAPRLATSCTARLFLRTRALGERPRIRDFAAATRGPTSVRSEGFTLLGYPVDAALWFPSALHVPASTPSFDFCRNFDRGHEPIENVVLALPLLPRGRAAEPSVALRRTTECRSLPDTGLQSCMVAHAASDVAFDDAGLQASLCDGAWCLDCEPRTPRRSSFDDRRALARVDGLERRNPTRRRIEPLLEVRRAPFVTDDADAVGWRSDTSPARTVALRRRPEHVFDRGSPSTCAPRRAPPLTNRGAIRRRSLVCTHAADCSTACCMHERAEALRLATLRSRNLGAFSTWEEGAARGGDFAGFTFDGRPASSGSVFRGGFEVALFVTL